MKTIAMIAHDGKKAEMVASIKDLPLATNTATAYLNHQVFRRMICGAM